MPAGSGAASRLTDAQRLAGIADALDLAREEAARLDDGHRTQTVTWRQLDDAFAALAIGIGRTPSGAEDLAERLTGLALQAETMADIAARHGQRTR